MGEEADRTKDDGATAVSSPGGLGQDQRYYRCDRSKPARFRRSKASGSRDRAIKSGCGSGATPATSKNGRKDPKGNQEAKRGGRCSQFRLWAA